MSKQQIKAKNAVYDAILRAAWVDHISHCPNCDEGMNALWERVQQTLHQAEDERQTTDQRIEI